MQATLQYLRFSGSTEVFDKCYLFDTREFYMVFSQLVPGTVITISAHVVPVEQFVSTTVPGWLRDLKRGNFPPKVRAGIRTFPLCGGGGSQPQMKIFRDFNVTPQFTKYTGDPIEPGSYHLVAGTPEVGIPEVFAFVPTRFQDASGNPLTVDNLFPECNPQPSQPGQAWNQGWAVAVRLAAYTPIVDGEPLITSSGLSVSRQIASGPIQNANYAALTLDACWP